MVKTTEAASKAGRARLDNKSGAAATPTKTVAGDVDEQAVGPEEVGPQDRPADVGQKKLMFDTKSWQC